MTSDALEAGLRRRRTRTASAAAACWNWSCIDRAAGELDAVVQRVAGARRVNAEEHDAEHDERDGRRSTAVFQCLMKSYLVS